MTLIIFYAVICTIFSIWPVWKIRKPVAILFAAGSLGFILSLVYSFGFSWVLLTLFHLQSSAAGIANMLASLMTSMFFKVYGEMNKEKWRREKQEKKMFRTSKRTQGGKV